MITDRQMTLTEWELAVAQSGAFDSTPYGTMPLAEMLLDKAFDNNEAKATVALEIADRFMRAGLDDTTTLGEMRAIAAEVDGNLVFALEVRK